MRKIIFLVCVALFLLSTYAGHEFLAFDNGLTRTKDVKDQANIFKDLGYDGICTRPAKCTSKLLSSSHGKSVMKLQKMDYLLCFIPI